MKTQNTAMNGMEKNNDGSPLPEGTYYYVLSLKTNDGKDYVIKNFVEIIR